MTHGIDWSVIDADLSKVSNEKPNYSQTLRLAGLQITGGQAGDGAGVNINGYFTVEIEDCMITGNIATRVDPEDQPDTSGAGLRTSGGIIEDSVFRTGVPYGPIVKMTDSIIFANTTHTNDEDPLHPGIDLGGGMYLGAGTSLEMTSCKVIGNIAENGGGGIYFEGNPEINDPIGNVLGTTTTYLEIKTSSFTGNLANSKKGVASGGGVVIAGPTIAMISDTSFNLNEAKKDGGALQLIGSGNISDPGQPEYVQYVGKVMVVACTFEGNLAAQGPDPVPEKSKLDFGSGGAIAIQTTVNDQLIANVTISGNRAVSGKGGGAFIDPRFYKYGDVIEFDYDLNIREIFVVAGEALEMPIGMGQRNTITEIHNTTISDNKAGGQSRFDEGLNQTVLDGARGGGIAVTTTGNVEESIFVASTIVATNKLEPPAGFKGFGADLYAIDQSFLYTLKAPDPNPSGHNLVGVGDDGGLTLSADFGMTGTQIKPLDPQILPLNFYGGIVKTHPLSFHDTTDHSPAIDSGLNLLNLTFDERNSFYDRDVDILSDPIPLVDADIGAYELQLDSVLVDLTTWAYNKADYSTSIANAPSRIMRMVLRFSQQVIFPFGTGNAFLLKQIQPTGNGTVTLNVAPNVPNDLLVTLTFTGPLTETNDAFKSLIDGNYQLKAHADKIFSMFGASLDGDANGVPGGDFLTADSGPDVIYRLFGTNDDDRLVESDDFAAFRAVFGTTWYGNGVVFDFNGNGNVDSEDFAAFRARFGVFLTGP